MTLRQTLLKVFYPLIMKAGKITGSKNLLLYNSSNAKPPVSFYRLQATANNGTTINFEQFKGKKVLLINTASDCGYTGQYKELEKLYQQYKQRLMIIGFPANDFKEQESTVVKSAEQNPVFQWLTDKNKNGWNNQPPTWNFSKYLVNEEGILTSYFDPSISPVSYLVINAIKTELKWAVIKSKI